MERRNFLAASGLGIIAVGGPIGWLFVQSSKTDMGASTRHFEENILSENTSRGNGILDYKETNTTIITSAAEAGNNLISKKGVGEFVDNTDFASSYLVLIQNGMSSEMTLALDSISREEDSIHFDVSVEPPETNYAPDNVATHSLLVRIGNKEGGIPQSVSLDIEGYV